MFFRVVAILLFLSGISVLAWNNSLEWWAWIYILAGTFGTSRIFSKECVFKDIQESIKKYPNVYELTACPRCSGTWLALCLTMIYIYTPAGPIICGIIGVSGANILLQEIMGVISSTQQKIDGSKEECL